MGAGHKLEKIVKPEDRSGIQREFCIICNAELNGHAEHVMRICMPCSKDQSKEKKQEMA